MGEPIKIPRTACQPIVYHPSQYALPNSSSHKRIKINSPVNISCPISQGFYICGISNTCGCVLFVFYCKICLKLTMKVWLKKVSYVEY